MKRMFLVLGTAIVILPWLVGARVQADAIHWSASGSPLGPNFSTNGSATIYSLNLGVNAQVDLLPGPTTSGTNSGSVVLTQLVASSDPDIGGDGNFGGPSANYSLSLALRDDASGTSGALTFRGNLSGWTFQGGPAILTNTILGSTTQTLTLGQDLYTVTIGPFVNPSGAQDGSISASIAVQPAVNSAPEPSSLMLACLGLPPLGLARWLRRHRCRDLA